MKKLGVAIIIVLIMIIGVFSSYATELPEEATFTLIEDYGQFTITLTSDNWPPLVVESADEKIAEIGFVIDDPNHHTLTVAGIPKKPGKTYFHIKAKDTGEIKFSVPVVVPENKMEPTTNASSVLDNETVKKLISSCPAISSVSQDTQDLYESIADYKDVFPNQDGKIHTWKISIQKGTFLFGDEKKTTILRVTSNGKASEIAPSLKWEIKLLEALPQIKEAAAENGVTLILEKRVDDDGDYSYLADKEGIIDLLNEEKYKAVFKLERSSLESLETIDSFSSLGELDTNGNGQIDFDELFK